MLNEKKQKPEKGIANQIKYSTQKEFENADKMKVVQQTKSYFKQEKDEQNDLLLDSPDKKRSFQHNFNEESPINCLPPFSASITLHTPKNSANTEPLFVKIAEFPVQAASRPPLRRPSTVKQPENNNLKVLDYLKKDNSLFKSRSIKRSVSKSRISNEKSENSGFALQ